MATTRLVDVFNPVVYGTYGAIDDPTLMSFLESGIMRTDPTLDALADGPSQLFTVPYWNDLDSSSEPNASTDNPDDIAVPSKITSGSWMGRKAELNFGWSVMDLSRELALADPLPAIRDRTSRWWNRQKLRRLLATVVGVMRSNIANNAGDMVKDYYSATSGTITDANRFNSDVFIDAAFTLGDRADSVKAIAVHSVVAKTMTKQGLVGSIPVDGGRLTVPSYLDRPLVVSDSMPVETINGNLVYTSVLFAAGAIGFGEGTPNVPAEVYRDVPRGNGGGMETLWERKTWLMHPAGFAWNNGDAAGTVGANTMPTGQPMEANLSAAVRWTRVNPRKLVPMAFFRTNG